jgi:hypothetical protein
METTAAATAVAQDSALLLARRACYRFVALALADPRTGIWNELANPVAQALVTQPRRPPGRSGFDARPLGLGNCCLGQPASCSRGFRERRSN